MTHRNITLLKSLLTPLVLPFRKLAGTSLLLACIAVVTLPSCNTIDTPYEEMPPAVSAFLSPTPQAPPVQQSLPTPEPLVAETTVSKTESVSQKDSAPDISEGEQGWYWVRAVGSNETTGDSYAFVAVAGPVIVKSPYVVIECREKAKFKFGNFVGSTYAEEYFGGNTISAQNMHASFGDKTRAEAAKNLEEYLASEDVAKSKAYGTKFIQLDDFYDESFSDPSR